MGQIAVIFLLSERGREAATCRELGRRVSFAF